MCWACVDPPLRVPMIAYNPSQMRHHHVRILNVDSNRERTLGGKRFVSASLAAPEGTANVTNTESRHFRQSTLAKALHAPRSEHICMNAVTEFCDTCKCRFAAVLTTYIKLYFCDTCRSFYARTWTRRTPKQLFQQLTFSMSWRSD